MLVNRVKYTLTMTSYRNTMVCILCLLMFLGLVSIVHADIFSYTDKNGTVHFTNISPGRGSKYKVYLKSPDRRKPRKGVSPIPARDKSPERFIRYDAYIHEASLLYQIPEAFIRAVIHVESSYDPRVISWAGAEGLMQLMPGTARRMGVEDSFDPRQNIMGGTRYLRTLANLFDGDIMLTIAGYHAGEGAVQRYKGVPPYTSTIGYIKKVLGKYHEYAEKKKLASNNEMN